MRLKRIVCLLIAFQLFMNFVCFSEEFYFDFSEKAASDATAVTAVTREVTLCYLSDEASEMTYVTRTLAADDVDVLISNILAGLFNNSYIREIGSSPEAVLPRYELSRGTLTIDLPIDTIGSRTEQELLLVCAALANSFLNLEEIDAVNVLFGGRSIAVSGIPIGVFTQAIDNSSLLYAESEAIRTAVTGGVSITRNALLYYPASGSSYIIPHIKEVSVTDSDCILPILNALCTVPEDLEGTCSSLPRFTGLLLADPEISTTNTGERMVRLSFDNVLPDFLAMSGISAEDFYDSIALSLLSFLPDIAFIQFCVANEPVTALPAANGKMLTDTNGCISRTDLIDAIGSTADLYMLDSGDRLVKTCVVAGCHSCVNPTGILSMLFDTRSNNSLTSAVPEGIGGIDILSITANGSSATVDLSSNFYTRCQSLDESQERRLAYAIINTLCALTDIKSVRCTIEGKDMDCFVHSVQLSSYLMPDPGMTNE